MKLTKAEKWVLALTLLFCAVTVAYRMGQRSVPAAFSVRSAAETAVQAAESARMIPTETATLEKSEEPEPVNINSADRDLLCSLSGIGEVLADRIIAYREENGPFGSPEEIKHVSGIGDGIFEKISSRICVD